jgi:hypothetical protein
MMSSRTFGRVFLGVVTAALLSASSVFHGQTSPDRMLLVILHSPEQIVHIPDEEWSFKAGARLFYDGTARGGAVRERGAERYEFWSHAGRYEAETETLTLTGEGMKTTGRQEQEFEFVATVSPSASGGDILIYDIKDGFVYEKEAFEAEGRKWFCDSCGYGF